MKTKSKFTFVPSTDKTENECWNSFDPERWNKFKCELSQHIKFVDIIPPSDTPEFSSLKYWKNESDTAVFLLDTSKINPLALVAMTMRIAADEFDFEPVGKNKSIVRIWWD